MTTPVRDALPDGVPALTGDVLAIRGGRPLRGRVDVKGAKNLATKAMVASLLGETVSTLRDVPAISDVAVVRSLLEVHGVRVSEGDEPGSLVFDPSDVESAHFEQIDGDWTSEQYVGDLENGGVSIAPFHDFEDKVPQELKDGVEKIKEQIISGEIVVETPNQP